MNYLRMGFISVAFIFSLVAIEQTIDSHTTSIENRLLAQNIDFEMRKIIKILSQGSR